MSAPCQPLAKREAGFYDHDAGCTVSASSIFEAGHDRLMEISDKWALQLRST